VLALTIVFITDVLLQVSTFMFVVSLGTITCMTFALSGLAVGFGTLFPQFETENAAQIPTSFGGLMYMMASVTLIGIVVLIEARPVYSSLLARSQGATADFTEMAVFFGLSALVCVTATVVPLRMARRRLDGVER
jgi:ABC-2 type transport system permease protein